MLITFDKFKLNESPDIVNYAYAKWMTHEDYDAFAFGYSGKKFIINRGTHGGSVSRNKMTHTGRLWYDREIISFWKYPKNVKKLEKIIRDIEKNINIHNEIGLNIWDNDEWRIEVPIDENDNFVDPGGEWDNEKFITELVPLKEFEIKERRTIKKFKPEDFEHIKSPINKTKKKDYIKRLPIEFRMAKYQESIINFEELITEGSHYKFFTINEFFDYVESLEKNWIFIDTETTGLGGSKRQQLTQISGIQSTINGFDFVEKETFNEKIELQDDIKKRMKKDSSSISKVLSFTRYGSGDFKYKDEQEVLKSFIDWLGTFDKPNLVFQNAIFDMNMIGGRSGEKLNYKVIDTKMFIQYYYIPVLLKLAESDDKFKEILDKIGISDRDGGLTSSSMGRIAPSLGVSTEGYHDALVDCKMTLNMLSEMLKFLDEYRDIDILKYQIERYKLER